jgi:hypothetical protein
MIPSAKCPNGIHLRFNHSWESVILAETTPKPIEERTLGSTSEVNSILKNLALKNFTMASIAGYT